MVQMSPSGVGVIYSPEDSANVTVTGSDPIIVLCF